MTLLIFERRNELMNWLSEYLSEDDRIELVFDVDNALKTLAEALMNEGWVSDGTVRQIDFHTLPAPFGHTVRGQG